MTVKAPFVLITAQALACLTAATQEPTDHSTPVFGSEVEAVYVDAFVTRDGKPATGLSASDFELRDDGVLQDIQLVSADSRPIVAVLICDTSDSTEGKELLALKDAAGSLLNALRPEDSVGLLGFSEEVAWLAPPSTDRDRVLAALSRVRAQGKTAMFDALYAGVELTDALRPLVVLLSDGDDNASWLGRTQLMELTERSSAVIDVVLWRPPLWARNAVLTRLTEDARPGGGQELASTAESALQKIAEAAGGQVFAADSPRKLKEALGSIIESMRHRYILSYPARRGRGEGWHRIEVRLRRRGAVVRARKGYWLTGHGR